MEAKMLDGKVAIITGASYGMGQTMAELFADEGAAVVLTARGKEKLDAVVDGIRKKGGRAIGVVADVCSKEDRSAEQLIHQRKVRSTH
ncbi:SDR family NAD(P)-dependent oxidoreductase [Enterocloster aldenensis]|uniref:SDR family NAD(P)-dependent oxidoreductase n=1 Tax=Enterocloster aldenensis TaxID=358742 RepID=UPI001A9AFAA9